MYQLRNNATKNINTEKLTREVLSGIFIYTDDVYVTRSTKIGMKSVYMHNCGAQKSPLRMKFTRPSWEDL
jgi:hypothetical protein